AFIAVGALHLPGELGLVQLLKDRGYSVTRP
ncbi:MAG: TraB/GumN family protein, partial [Pseudomonadota bacterium]